MNNLKFPIGTTLFAAAFLCSSAIFAQDVKNNISWPDQIGPFIVKSDKNDSSLRLGFAAQGLVQFSNIDTGETSGRIGEHTIKFRRIRESLKGSLISKDLTYAFQLSTNTGSLELMDLWINYRFNSLIQARVGQNKTPFTRYRLGSFKKLTLVDWSITSTAFGAERQRGITIHNGFDSSLPVTYAIGLYTGENVRASAEKGLASIYGKSLSNQSDLIDPAPPQNIHPELVAHFFYNHGEIDTSIDTDLSRGPFRFSLGISAAYDMRPNRIKEFSHRIAPELLLKARGFSFSSLFYAGFAESAHNPISYGHAMTGVLVQMSYLTLNRIEFSARYAFTNADDSLLEESRKLANDEITVLEIEREEVSAAAQSTDSIREAELNQLTKEIDTQIQTLTKVGTLNTDHELSFGLNIFIIGTSLRWQNDLSWLRHVYTNNARNDVRFRSQLTIAF